MSNAFQRGMQDAMKGRAPIFRDNLQPSSDDPMADDWSEDDRREYRRGYDAGDDC